jgi:hypothetical protein
MPPLAWTLRTLAESQCEAGLLGSARSTVAYREPPAGIGSGIHAGGQLERLCESPSHLSPLGGRADLRRGLVHGLERRSLARERLRRHR